jgi:non-specific serine/threonine protein kinase
LDRVIFQCGDLRVDPANRRLTRGGVDITLEAKAFAVLLMLLGRVDELITRDELLDAVWGHRHLTPATLNRVMALLRRVLDDDADQPRFISTVHGAGYRFIGAVERVSVEREEVRAHFGPPPTARLPARLEPLIGREHELKRLQAMLAEHRAVTLIGPGGMGKTQCALEVGRLCAPGFPDGVWFFDLSPFERAQDWVNALAATLSVPIAGTQTVLQRTAAALAGRKALLLIDNCDRLAVEVGSRVLDLLRSCVELKILATSQQRLDFVGENLMWLPPLDLPPAAYEAARLPIDDIASTPSVALLLARGDAAQPGLSLAPNNVADIVEICRRVDGMPLALELAAAQFATLSPKDVRERLSRHFGLLASGSAGREPRHETMQALVEWSYSLLSAREQRLLCWLSVFVQGWTIDALDAFATELKLDGAELLKVHSGLVLKSLVVVDPTLSPPRYRLLEPVREFALQLLRARGEESAARRTHLDHFVKLAERSHSELLKSRAEEWVRRLSHEHANIDAALAWAKLDGRDEDSALRLAGSLMIYGKSGGIASHWLVAAWAERALNGVVPAPSHTYVRALLCSGVNTLYVQDSTIEAHLSSVVVLATRLGDRWAQSCASAYLALWDAHLGRLAQARERATIAARLASAESDEWLLSIAGWAKGWIALGSGDYDAALATLQPLRDLSFDPQQRQMIAIYLSLTHYALRHWREAAARSVDVVDMSLRTRGLRATAAAIEIAGYLAMRIEHPEVCARLLAKAADIRERSHAPLFSFWVAHNEEAMVWVRTRLQSDRFDACYRAGATARDELIIDEARTLLWEVADGQAAPVPPHSGR